MSERYAVILISFYACVIYSVMVRRTSFNKCLLSLVLSTGEPKLCSTDRRSASSGAGGDYYNDTAAASDRARSARNAARDRLEELLSTQSAAAQYDSAEYGSSDQQGRQQQTRASPNKKRSHLTVSVSEEM